MTPCLWNGGLNVNNDENKSYWPIYLFLTEEDKIQKIDLKKRKLNKYKFEAKKFRLQTCNIRNCLLVVNKCLQIHRVFLKIHFYIILFLYNHLTVFLFKVKVRNRLKIDHAFLLNDKKLNDNNKINDYLYTKNDNLQLHPNKNKRKSSLYLFCCKNKPNVVIYSESRKPSRALSAAEIDAIPLFIFHCFQCWSNPTNSNN